MFELYTDEAHKAIRKAVQEARRVGASSVDPGHLLLGLVSVDNSVAQLAMARLGVTAEAVRATRAASVAEPAEGSVPFRAETKAALESALREAIALGNRILTTGHLLLGVAYGGVEPAPTDAMRAAVLREHADGSSPEIGGRPLVTNWSDLSLGPAPQEIPARRSWLMAAMMAIGWYAVVFVAIIGLTWDEMGPETVGAAFVACAGILGLAGALYPRRVARQLTKARVALDPPAEVAEVLARRGLTAQIRVSRGRGVWNGCIRRGSTAWILLTPDTLANPRRVGFVIAHEVAHLLRNDHARRRLDTPLGAALMLSAYVTFDPRAWLIGFGGVIVFQVATRWRSELASDAFAVRWVGVAALRAWANDHLALLRRAPNRGWRRRLRRARNYLTHPPMALRKAVHSSA